MARKATTMTAWETPERLQKLTVAASEGKSLAYIADEVIGIRREEFAQWRQRSSKISGALQAGNRDARSKVQQRLFEMATQDLKSKRDRTLYGNGTDENGDPIVLMHEVIKESRPPSVSAAESFLKWTTPAEEAPNQAPIIIVDNL